MHMSDIGTALAERGLALQVRKYPNVDRSRRFHASLVRSGIVQTTSTGASIDEAVKKVLARAGVSVNVRKKHRG